MEAPKRPFPTPRCPCSILPDETAVRFAFLRIPGLRSAAGASCLFDARWPGFGPARSRLLASLNFLNLFSLRAPLDAPRSVSIAGRG
jgi:hypothetical protein